MSSLVIRITGDPTSFQNAMDGVGRSLDGAARKAEAVSAKLSSLGNSLSIGITLPAIAAGTALVKTVADMEALRMGLTAVAGSSAETEKQLVRLKEVAKLPGLGFAEAIQGSVRLQSAGFSAQLAERSLKAFGNALATVGKGKAELDGVTLALSQIASKGKISAEEINQLAERVPQIRVAMKEAFGTADTEVLQKAGIKAEEFVTRVVAQLEKLKPVTGGTKNSFENLADAFQAAGDRIGQKLLPAVNEAIPKVESLVNFAVEAVEAFSNLPKPIKDTAIAFGILAVSAGPIATLAGNIGKLTTGALALGKALGGIPTAITVGVTMLVTSVIRDLPDIKKELNPDNYGKPGSNFTDAFRQALTGKSRDMEQSIAAINSTIGGLANAPSTFQILNDKTNTLRSSILDLSGGFKKLGEESQKTSNVLKANSVADLIYIESLQRMKSAVEKAKDIMYEWSIQGTALGKQMDTWKAPVSAMSLEFESMSGAIWTATENMKMLSNLRPPQIEINKQGLENQSRVGIVGMNNAAKTLGFETDQERYNRLQNLSKALDEIRAAYDRGQASGTDLAKAQDAYNKAAREGTPATKTQREALKQVSTIVTDLSRGITDIIFKGGKFGDMMANVAKQAAQAITRELIEGALSKLSKKLLDVGGIFGKVFGGGTGPAMSAVPGVTAVGLENGGLGSLPGLGGSAGGSTSAAGAAASSVAGIVGAVGSVVSAVSGVIGNFQMMGMNKTLDLIEKEVRYSQIHLLNTLNKANEYWPYMKTCWESLIRMEQRQMAVGGGGVTNHFAGAYFLTDSAFEDFMQKQARWLKAQGF